MKKLFPLISSVVLLLGIAGCNSKPDFNKLVVRMKYSHDAIIRIRIVEELSAIKDPNLVDTLMALIRPETLDGNVYSDAIEVLGNLGDKRAVDELISRIMDHDLYRHSIAINALEKIDTAWRYTEKAKSYVPVLIKQLESDDVLKKSDAVQILGMIADKRAEEPLIRALSEKVPYIRTDLFNALGQIGGENGLKALVSVLKDNYNDTEEEAILSSIESKRMQPYLKGNKDIVDPLIKILNHSYNTSLRIRSISVMRHLRDDRIFKCMKENLTDLYVSRRIAESLSEYHWRPENRADSVHYFIAKRDKNSLMADWKKTREVLMSDLRSRDAKASVNAIYAFQGLADGEAIEDLVNIMNHQGLWSMSLAGFLINYGNQTLSDAAKNWAEGYGYKIESINGVSRGSLESF